uniref:Trypsin inhibitor 2 n=1 Tax=Opuntia streptacantha TaxID=393608 RepID=ITR2_OPUST|nr:RecName: Full=Trypsin inhibitor 2; Short=OsTI 2 [Opuntia streptacantha]
QQCAERGQSCNPYEGIECCGDILCIQPRIWPPVPGRCA